MTYRYNIRANPTLAHNLRRRQSIFDRLHWFLHHSRYPRRMARRRIPPGSLYGRDNLCTQPVDLAAIFYLRRGDKFSLKIGNPEAFVSAMAKIVSAQEYMAFSRFLLDHNIVNPIDWEEKYKGALLSRFSKASTSIINLRVPSDRKYGLMAEHITEKINEISR